MDTNKTSLERAFDLAKSGNCANLTHIIIRVRREGYDSFQIEGPSLKKQLALLIAEAKSTNATRHIS
jgi:hypothetical protein